MRLKLASFVTAAACCALLASCGGGGDGSPTPAPTPTPSPTPTATPTPTAVDFDFTKAFTSTATNTGYAYAYFTPTGGAETWNDGARSNGTSKITYAISPESVAFDFTDTATLTTFAAGDLQSATATKRVYRKGTDGIVLELPFKHALRVSYESTQAFTLNSVAGMLRGFRVALFFNPVTVTTDIATNLSYTGVPQVAGGKPGTTPPGVFTSAATTLTVTASTKKIEGTLNIFETVNGNPVLRAALPISATLMTGGSFSGTIDDTANGFKGSFVGSLAGPSREEVLLIFNVAHTDGRELIGSFIGD